MNPVVALFLANSVTATTTFSVPSGATPITTLREAEQSDPLATDPAATAATTTEPAVECDADPANRVYLNTQDDTATGTWPYDTCASSCFTSETVEEATLSGGIAATAIPTWSVNLGGEYLVSHVQVLIAQDTTPSAGTQAFTPSGIAIAPLPASGAAGPTWTDTTETFSGSAAYGAWDTVTIATPVKGHMLQIKAPTKAADTTNSIKASSTLKFCGIKVYGAPSPLELIAAPTTAENDQCEDDKEASEEEKKELEEEKDALVTEKEIITTEKEIITTEKEIITSEKTMLTKEKEGVEAERDSYINPTEDCGGLRLFGRQFCKLPKKEKDEE